MSNGVSTDKWFQDYAEGHDELQVEEYDITATPNDFNVMTLCSFMDSGSVRIPGFQRHFVWDMARASKLIESLILGLPVPQLLLYEQKRNEFLVIDGQQRLMSIYYFIKKRFPRKEKREPGAQAQVGTDVAKHDPLEPVRSDGDGPTDGALQSA